MDEENHSFNISHLTPRKRGQTHPGEAKAGSARRDDCLSQTEGRSVAFLFAGMDMSAQWPQDFGMGADLYRREPVFRAVINECIECLTGEESVLLRQWLAPRPEERQKSDRPAHGVALPFLFAAQVALARLWMARGIHPAAMIGQGSGEYAAAHLAGVFTLREAITILRAHGQFLETQLSGLPFPAPATACDAILHPFSRTLASIRLGPPMLPFISALTGDWITSEQTTNPHYWTRRLHQPDRFMDGLAHIMATPDRVLLNIGPGRTLSELKDRQAARDLRACGLTGGGKAMEPPFLQSLYPPSPGLLNGVTGGACGLIAARSEKEVLPVASPEAIRTPLFLIHDGSGSIAIYEALAALMVHDRPILGIAPKQDDHGGAQPATIARMAKAYIARIRTMQPHGPYLLAGLGAGGVIAFEMAQQLQAMGQRTAFVGIIDGADVEAHERIFSLARLLYRAGILVRRPASGPAGAFANVWKRARRAHHPQGVFEGGDVVLFKTTCGTGAHDDRPASMAYTDCLLGWGKRAAGEVRLVMVPGGHHSALQTPHVESLARALSLALASALPDERSPTLAIASPPVTPIWQEGSSLRPGAPLR
ncbi:thioesterase domain-containing protein [Novosphingobium sp. SG751A]|uniref:thioesterase domain-containing protein n=1 Tax=Novosphingobium sp. SG751A TaxID=2587000 RepID=UPI0015574537|nr:acyltransferase domain-containing protein [Novosphingobium sp. SG751A]NOW46445.1 thioesterase domain-containing protein [Novosphingobium sp. SG751A]